MKQFVKETKMEANKQLSHGPISITNEVLLIDPEHKLSLSKDKQDWFNLRYKIVRSRWKKVRIRQDRESGPIQIDKVIKEPPDYFLTARPKETEASIDKKKGAPSTRMVRIQSSSLDFKEHSQSLQQHGSQKGISQRQVQNLFSNPKVAPNLRNSYTPKPSSFRKNAVGEAQDEQTAKESSSKNPMVLAKLREKVLKVVSAMKIKEAGEERVAKVSNNAERSVSQFQYTLASPDKDREKKVGVRPPRRRGSRRLSSGSNISFNSRVSDFADLRPDYLPKKPSRKVIAAMPAKSLKPEQDRSKGDREDSMESSASPSKKSVDSGFEMIHEDTPKVILLNQTAVDTSDFAKLVTYRYRYNRDAADILRKIKLKGTKIDVQNELLENSDYRHVRLNHN
jgi:hypothetical protein